MPLPLHAARAHGAFDLDGVGLCHAGALIRWRPARNQGGGVKSFMVCLRVQRRKNQQASGPLSVGGTGSLRRQDFQHSRRGSHVEARPGWGTSVHSFCIRRRWRRTDTRPDFRGWWPRHEFIVIALGSSPGSWLSTSRAYVVGVLRTCCVGLCVFRAAIHASRAWAWAARRACPRNVHRIAASATRAQPWPTLKWPCSWRCRATWYSRPMGSAEPKRLHRISKAVAAIFFIGSKLDVFLSFKDLP